MEKIFNTQKYQQRKFFAQIYGTETENKLEQ